MAFDIFSGEVSGRDWSCGASWDGSVGKKVAVGVVVGGGILAAMLLLKKKKPAYRKDAHPTMFSSVSPSGRVSFNPAARQYFKGR